VSDELDKKQIPQDDEAGDKAGDEDVEAHRTQVGRTQVGAADDENDVEAHRTQVGRTQVGKTQIN
jgi:hypothetical protein